MTISDPSNPPGGYYGRYLRVDLSTGQSRFVPLAEDILRRFLGGSGLGVWLMLHEGAAKVDPLSANAAIAFVFSPLVGSPLTTSAKFAVVCKSPLTERINDSLSSSHFAISGKACGCDAIVIVGQAIEPSVLVVDDGQIRVEPAGDAWGMECPAAEETLRQRHGSDFHCAVIGPAGERQVRYASISHAGRHAGRGGGGAVFGAKNLKALLVRGTQRCSWSDTNGLIAYAKDLSKKSFGPATEKYRELGTAANLLTMNRLGALPTRNFQQGSFDGAEAISPEQLGVAREKTRAYCAACTIGCEHIYALDSKNHQGESGGVRLEYENLFALGPLCGISDADVVLRASKYCDAAGIDTISAGGTIAFAMECAERGLIDAPWLRFGDGDALLRALREITAREGLGRRLAEGSRRLAHEIGQNTIAFAPQVKGLEIPGYEPRALQTMALGFATGARGADHNRSGAYEVDFSEQVDRRNVGEEAAALAVETEDKAALMDSLILCKFLRGVFDEFYGDAADILRLVTGWEIDAKELRTTAAGIVTAKKQFNILAGWTPAEDTLPERFLSTALQDDAEARLTTERLSSLVRAYNLQRGWSEEGWIAEDQMATS